MKTKTFFSTTLNEASDVMKSFKVMSSLLGSFVLAVAASNAHGQTYHYEFGIGGITDPGAAKELTDLLRTEFNDETDPFKYYPSFNDATDTFDFRSDVMVEKEQLETLLTREQYVLQSWKLSEKREEE